MSNYDGYSLWNSDTPMGRALRDCFPGNVIDLSLRIAEGEMPTVIVRYQMPSELMNVDWTQFLFDSEKKELGGTAIAIVNQKTGNSINLPLTKQQAEQLAEFVKEDK
jgi:hypothetical protein